MFSDSDKVNKFPHNGDRDNYFPTIVRTKEIEYGKVTFNKNLAFKDFK